jgi:hypothetical protein
MCFPFKARCITERTMSPLEDSEAVRVVWMASEGSCRSEMFVSMQWMDRGLGVQTDDFLRDADSRHRHTDRDWNQL